MKKMRYFVSIALMVLLSFMLLACGNKDNAVEEKTSEITQVEEKTSSVEDNTEEDDEYGTYEIVAEGQGKDIIASSSDSSKKINNATSSDSALTELPDVMEPLDNDFKCNPRITNLSIMLPTDFDRDRLLDSILSYMYYEGISDDTLKEIQVDERNSQGTNGYKMTLKFKKSKDKEITVFWYNNNYYDIQTYVDDSEIGFDVD